MSLKELAEVLGYDIKDEATFKIEDFKTHVDKTYVNRESALNDEGILSAARGRLLAPIQRQVTKAYGLTKEETENKPLNELLDIVKGKTDAQIKDLTEKAGKGDDAKVIEWKNKYDTEVIRANDLEKSLGLKETEWNGKNSELLGTIKNGKLNSLTAKAKEGIVFIDDFKTNKLLQTGFETELANKYKVDLDDKGELIVLDAKEGKPIINPKKSGHFLTYGEVVAIEAEAANLIKKNNANPEKKVIKRVLGDGNEKVPTGNVHPNAINREKMLNGN